MSRLYRSRWRSFEKTCLRCRRVVSFFKKCGDFAGSSNPLAFASHSKQKVFERSITLALRTKEEGEEGKDKDAMPLHVRKKKDDDKEEE